MSIQMHVFFCGKLPSKSALSKALKELGFPFTITPAAGSLEKQNGYIRMMLWDEESGVEFDIDNRANAIADYAGLGVDQNLERVVSLRWGSNMQECMAGTCCAAALASLLSGAVYDGEGGKLLSANEAIALAKATVKEVLRPKEPQILATRPADIKRFIKVLLEKRADLAVAGRILLIRPVRHFIRGVYLARTNNRYEIQIYHYLHPLQHKDTDSGIGTLVNDTRWTVYEPYIEYLLYDELVHGVFDDLGRLTEFSDLRARTDPYYSLTMDGYFDALVLSGKVDEARTHIDEMERLRSRDIDHRAWATEKRAVLANGIPALCEEYRRREAATAKALRLGKIWEPSPFPVELPEQDNGSRKNEPLFETAPWVDVPSTLWRELPDQAGEIMFASRIVERRGRKILWIPMTLQEAEHRHRNLEHYEVATRLMDRTLVTLRIVTLWDPHNPEPILSSKSILYRRYYLEILRYQGDVLATFEEAIEALGVLRLQQVRAFEASRMNTLWWGQHHFEKGTRATWDDRSGETIYKAQQMSDRDITRLTVHLSHVADISILIRCVHRYLDDEGIDSP